MRYYKAVDIDEHYPYAKEISEQLGYGWDKRISIMISKLLNSDLEKRGLDKLFYNTKYGIRQVYQNYEIAFEDAFKNKLDEMVKEIEKDYLD